MKKHIVKLHFLSVILRWLILVSEKVGLCTVQTFSRKRKEFKNCLFARKNTQGSFSKQVYLQCNVIGCFALRCVSSLVLSDVTGQCDQEVVTVAISDQSWGGVTLDEIQSEGGSGA